MGRRYYGVKQMIRVLKLKFLAVITAVALVFCVGITPVLASAEETAETPVESTEIVETEEDTKDYVLPVICGVTGLAGVGLVALFVWKKWGKVVECFASIKDWFSKRKEELDDKQVSLDTIKTEILEAVKSNESVKDLLEKAREKSAEEYRLIMEAVGEALQAVKDKAEEANKKYEQIMSILIKMTAGSEEYVRRGIADEVLKMVEEKGE